jgi:hypothetical protein
VTPPRLDDDQKPAVQWDELYESVDFRELFRYTKGLATHIYKLRPLPSGKAEVWVEEIGSSAPAGARLLTTFDTPEQGLSWVRLREHSLKADGWSAV